MDGGYKTNNKINVLIFDKKQTNKVEAIKHGFSFYPPKI